MLITILITCGILYYVILTAVRKAMIQSHYFITADQETHKKNAENKHP